MHYVLRRREVKSQSADLQVRLARILCTVDPPYHRDVVIFMAERLVDCFEPSMRFPQGLSEVDWRALSRAIQKPGCG